MVSERQRRWAPKVRTGCGTCKKRKKRCDETRPICQKCQKGGYVCDGYGSTTNTNAKLEVAVPRPAEEYIEEETCETLSGNLLAGAHINFVYLTSDQRCTQFFVARVAPVLATTRQWQVFWEDTIPFTSLNATPIHHAMLALSSAYESRFLNMSRDRTTDHQLSKAIKTSMRQPMTIDNTLILCRLLAAVSQSVGDWKTALIHLKYGWRILLEGKRHNQIDSSLLQLLGPTFLCASTHAFDLGNAALGTDVPNRESILKLDRIRSLFAVSMSALSWKAIDSSVLRIPIMLAWSNMTRALCALICANSSVGAFGIEPGTEPISVVSSELHAQGRILDIDDLHAESVLLLCELTESLTKLYEESIVSHKFATRLRFLTENFLVCAFMLDKNAEIGMFWSDHLSVVCDIDVHLLRLEEDDVVQWQGLLDGQLSVRLQIERKNQELYLERVCPYRSGFLPAFRGLN